ncbi:MAG: hypothetical protein ABWZ26_06605 [Candidatus Nanopelagicales bacterium]
MVPAALTCVAAALLAGAAYVSVPLTTLVVLLVQAGLAATWHRLVDAPAARGGFLIGALASLASAIVLLLDDEGGRIGPVVAVAAGLVPVVFLQQIMRPAGRERVVESMSAAVTVGVLCVGLATAIPLSRSTDGQDALLVGLAALGVAAVVADLLAGWTPGLALGAAVGTGVGFGLGMAVGLADRSGLGAVALVAVGPAVASVGAVQAGWMSEAVVGRLDPARAALPLALGIPLLYVLASVTVT